MCLQGLDETPRSPSRLTRHRKTPSQAKLRPDTPPEGKKDADNAQKKATNGSDKSSGVKPEEKAEQEKKKDAKTKNDDTVVFEKYEDEKKGEKLVSVKPHIDFERQLVQDRKESKKAPKDQDKGLVSGRRALGSWERSGIRFAPWNIPLQRRLQTAVVLFHTLCIALSVSIFFGLCAIPLFWPIVIPYLIYCMTSNASTSGTLSHRSELLRSSPVWSLFASYFPARLHRSAELSPTRKYIFGYHPHGIISHGAFAAFGTEALGFKQLFPGITNTLLTLDSNFRIPIYRDYALAMGLGSVSRESCENLLSKGGVNKEGMGRAITIVVGGARESLDATPRTLRLVLKRRYGFIKIAARTGADLVPVIAFGENDLYDQFLPDEHPNIHKAQLILKKFLGFTIPLFHARGVFNYDVGLMPYRRPLNIVVGRPIQVERKEKPEKEYLEELHGKYVEEVQRLWDTWKGDFAPERKEELMFVE